MKDMFFDSHNNIDHIWTLSEPYGARDWWPCKDDPSDKADSVDIKILSLVVFLFYLNAMVV